MKLTLRATMSLLFTGRRRNISEAVSVKPKFSFSIGDESSNRCCAGFIYSLSPFSGKSISQTRMLDKLQLQGVRSLKRSLHSSSDGDDDFSELGLPVAKSKDILSKLFTEKPEVFRKYDSSRRVTSGISLCGKSNSSMKGVPLKQGNHNSVLRFNIEDHNGVCRAEDSTNGAPNFRTSVLPFNIENHKGVCRAEDSINDAPNFRTSSSITIKNVPSVISLSQLKEALSTFGNIVKVSVGASFEGFNCCNVEFEILESRKRAVAAGGITVESYYLPIHRLCVLENVIIRISNISVETADPEIHSMCRSFGPMEGLVRTNEDAVDVFYNVKVPSAANSILKKLNGVSINNCQWIAHLLPRDTTPTAMTNTCDNQRKVGSQINDYLEDLKRQMDMKKIYLEDLEDLHFALVHLQSSGAKVQ